MNTYTYAHVLQQNFAMVQSTARTALAATEVGQTEEGSNSYHLSCCCGGPWVRSQDKHTLTSEQKHRWIKDHCLMHHHIKGTMHCLFNCWTSSTGKSHNACIAQPHHPICCSVTSTLAESTPLHPATQTYNKSSLCKRHPNPQPTCMHVCRGRVISRSVYNIVQHMSKDVGGRSAHLGPSACYSNYTTPSTLHAGGYLNLSRALQMHLPEHRVVIM
jgi:hypothetical protein